jgi:hypothetical protein
MVALHRLFMGVAEDEGTDRSHTLLRRGPHVVVEETFEDDTMMITVEIVT